MYKIEEGEEKNPFRLLASFFINLMPIPQSNCYIERQLSQISLNKSEKRNLLDVATVSSILKVRSFYEDRFEMILHHYEKNPNKKSENVAEKFCGHPARKMAYFVEAFLQR